eukprot:4301510-Amphidinium_carterae.2
MSRAMAGEGTKRTKPTITQVFKSLVIARVPCLSFTAAAMRFTSFDDGSGALPLQQKRLPSESETLFCAVIQLIATYYILRLSYSGASRCDTAIPCARRESHSSHFGKCLAWETSFPGLVGGNRVSFRCAEMSCPGCLLPVLAFVAVVPSVIKVGI